MKKLSSKLNVFNGIVKTCEVPIIKRRRKNTLPLFIIFLLLLVATSFRAQLLIGWDASNNGGGFGASPWTPVTLNPNITLVNGLTRGASILTSGTPAGSCWGGGGGGWGTTDAGSIYFVFSVPAGYVVSLSSITSALRRSTTGPVNCNIEYSLNGGSYTVAGAWSTNVTSGTVGQANSSALSGFLNLQNIVPGTVVRFRITFPGGGGGNWYVTGATNCLRLNGTVTQYSASIVQTASVQCNGQSNGALSVNVTGGIPPYTYSWSPAGGTSSVATGLGAGIYTCTVTDAILEVVTPTFNLTQPTVLTSTIVSQTNVTCNGGTNGSVTIAAGGGTPSYSYTWLPIGGNTPSKINLAAGSYTCNVKDAHNCITSQVVSITQPSPIVITATPGNTILCNGSTVSLSGSGANTYTWTGGIIDGIPFTPTVTTSYTVNATDINGCIGFAVADVTVNPNPTITIIPGNVAVCDGSTVSLSGTGANTYSWTGGITDGIPFTPTVTTSYTVNATDINGCIGSAVADVTVNPSPTVTVIPGNIAVCDGSTVTLNGVGANTYSWTGGIIDGIPFTPTITNSYTVNAADINGCIGSAVADVTVNPNPTITVIPGNVAVCDGSTVSLSGAGANTYTWTGGITDGIPFTPTITNSYTVNATDINGCIGFAVADVTVNPNPTITVLPLNIIICNGFSVTLNAVGANTYTWTGGVINGVPFTPSVTASYTVNGTDINGCAGSAVADVTVNPNPTITIIPGNVAVCNGSTVSLNGVGANTYTWTGGIIDGIPFTPTVTTSYTVNATDINGCIGSAVADVTVNPNPTVTIIPGNVAICNGSTVSLSGTGANTYTWTGGIIDGAPFTPTVTNSYTVNATDINGCIGFAVADVTVNPNPTVTIIPGNVAVCNGSTVALSGVGANTYSWTGGIINGVPFTPTITTSYTLTGTGINGCNGSAAVNVTVNPSPTVVAVSSNSLLCAGEKATLTASGASTYSWSTGALTSTIGISPVATTFYTVTGTGVNGCINQFIVQQIVAECTGMISKTTNDKNFKVFPNPSNGAFTIKTSFQVELFIINELGQMIQSVTLNDSNNYEYTLNGLTNGIYFIKDADNRMIKQKIIVYN